jgi:hypothetical protein
VQLAHQLSIQLNKQGRNMTLRLFSILLTTTFLFLSNVAFSADVIKKTAKGEINWSQGTVSAIGYGVATGKMPEAKQRLMARRAAQIDAYRNLAELVNGVKVSSDTFVRDMVVDNDKVKTSVNALIKGAAITSEEYENGMAIITVTMSLDGRFIQSITPELPKAGDEPSASTLIINKTMDLLSDIELGEMLSALSPISVAYAQEQGAELAITSAEQLKVAKKLLKLLNDQPKETVLQQLQQTVSSFEYTTNFTGILIDAREVSDFELATIPRLRSPDGKIIYPEEKNLLSGKISQRPVSYDLHIEDAVQNQRIAVKPIIIEAQGVYRSRYSDLVIDEDSAALLQSHAALLSALEKGAVMIVIGK